MIDDGGFRCIVYRSNFATVPSWSFFHYFYLFWGEERDDGWLYHVRGRWGWWFVGHIIFSWCDLEGKKFGKSLLLMSCRIFRRADRMTSFAIVIYFAKKFVFNSENSVISFANHLDGSCGRCLYHTVGGWRLREASLGVVGSVDCWLSELLLWSGYNNFPFGWM